MNNWQSRISRKTNINKAFTPKTSSPVHSLTGLMPDKWRPVAAVLLAVSSEGVYSVFVGLPWLVCVFDLRYPGVHQSGSWSGQHQGGGRWTLPRHEWERRALWVGESNPSFSFTTPPSLCSPGSHSQVWHLVHLICFTEHTIFKPFSENTVQYWALKIKKKGFQEQRESSHHGIQFVIKVLVRGRWENPQWDKTSLFLLQSLTLSISYLPLLLLYFKHDDPIN